MYGYVNHFCRKDWPMNTTQFIQQHGVDKAREVVNGAPERATSAKPSLDFKHLMYGICENATGAYILLSELKHLVESVDLVEHFGNDLVGAKQLLEFSKDCKTIELSGSVITVERLKQAIADYESVYSIPESVRQAILNLEMHL